MGFEHLDINNEYRTSVNNMSTDFYMPILKEAIQYDRAVGFFSSTSLIHIADGLLPFINRGGMIRLVVSPILSEDDVIAIREGYKRRDEVVIEALERVLYEPRNFVEQQRLNLLANLIADCRLDIKVALTKDYGIYHEKLGLFHDDRGNTIAFSGSMNETITAMKANYESIDVFCSWKTDEDQERVEAKCSAFEKIWRGEDNSISTMEFPKLKDSILKKYRRKKLIYEKLKESDFDIDEDYIENTDFASLEEKKEDRKIGARLPEGFELRDYQTRAIDSWENQGYRGIFDMATGTGKTYTGLGAAARLSEALEDKMALIIVCPYQHLVEQWVEDIILFGMRPIVGYSASKQKDWKKKFEQAVRDQKLKVKNCNFFCFITTNATFTSEYVQTQLRKIRSNILLMVDEAHNFGAESLVRLLDEKYTYRLALSATLDRHGDPEGTRKLLNYFGDKCIEYSLDRAIEEHKLTPYKYYPIIVSLSDNERTRYEDLSKIIAKSIIRGKDGKIKLSERGKRKALERSRLVAGAIQKVDALREYIQPYINDKHILVYCGATTVKDSNSEFMEVDEEEIRQIDLVTDLLGNELHMKVSQFTSKEDVEERDVLKQEFADGDNLQSLIAIKCLDEGVNIPKIKVAFILASTTNPKEYIQRRGRVLRLAAGKEFAEIYDFITLPRPLDEVPSLTQEEMKKELTLVKNELCRAEEFARIAMNGVSATATIEEIKEAYDLQDYILEYEEDYYYGDE